MMRSDAQAGMSAERLEVVLQQHLPLMHTRHCLFAAALSDGRRCGDCGWHCGGHRLALRDRSGGVHPVWRDEAGCNTIFDGTVRPAANALPLWRAAGARHFRVELLEESAAEARTVIARWAELV
jgi:putative protease